MGEGELDRSIMDLPEDVLYEARILSPDDPKGALGHKDFWDKFWADRSFDFEDPEAVRETYAAEVARYEAALGRDNPLARKLIDMLGEDGADEILAPAQGRKSKLEQIAEEEERKRVEEEERKKREAEKAAEEARLKAEAEERDRLEKERKVADYENIKKRFLERWKQEEVTILRDSTINSTFGRFSKAMDLLHESILSTSSISRDKVAAGFEVLLIPRVWATYEDMEKFLTTVNSFRDELDLAKAIFVPKDLRDLPDLSDNKDNARVRFIHRALFNVAHSDVIKYLPITDPVIKRAVELLGKHMASSYPALKKHRFVNY